MIRVGTHTRRDGDELTSAPERFEHCIDLIWVQIGVNNLRKLSFTLYLELVRVAILETCHTHILNLLPLRRILNRSLETDSYKLSSRFPITIELPRRHLDQKHFRICSDLL